MASCADPHDTKSRAGEGQWGCSVFRHTERDWNHRHGYRVPFPRTTTSSLLPTPKLASLGQGGDAARSVGMSINRWTVMPEMVVALVDEAINQWNRCRR